jgi:hypothetical protein
MEATTQFFGRRLYTYKQVLEFHRPSKFFLPYLGVKSSGPYCGYKNPQKGNFFKKEIQQ